MKPHETDLILRRALNEIKTLRHQNALLGPKAEAYEVLRIAIIGLAPGEGRAMAPDIVQEIEELLRRNDAEEATKAKGKTNE